MILPLEVTVCDFIPERDYSPVLIMREYALKAIRPTSVQKMHRTKGKGRNRAFAAPALLPCPARDSRTAL